MTGIFWTFPLLMAASIAIGWAAEITSVHLSAGIALAVLAWLQTLPEFAVEANIAWHQNSHLALANLTGSLRLLMGFGWPMVFLIHWVSQWRKGKRVQDLVLPESFAVEAAGLVVPVVYFLVILVKETWTAFDGVILCGFYGFYFWLLNQERKHGTKPPALELEADEEAPLVRWILKQSSTAQWIGVLVLFGVGGTVLYFVVEPFVESLKTVALAMGVSEFVFIQWIAPVASEMPEKITAFGWARKPRKVPMAIVNMLSSVTSQWTLLAGLVPIVFSISAGRFYTIELSDFQQTEILLTVVQSALAVIFLADLKIRDYEVLGLFILWVAQFAIPSAHFALVPVYVLWFIVEAIRLAMDPKQFTAWKQVRRIFHRAK